MIRSNEGSFRGEGGTRLTWRTWVPADPHARVLIVHGLGEHGGRYELLAGALAGRGFGVMTYDQRGHGTSGGARGHAPRFENLTSDLALALRAIEYEVPLSEAQPGSTGLIAHSMGGLVGLHHLISGRTPRPTCAVISAPWLGTARHVPPVLRGIAAVVDRFWPSAPFANLKSDPANLTRDPVMIQAWRDDPLTHSRISPRFFFEAERAQKEVLAHEGGLGLPALVLVPTDDRVVDQGLSRTWSEGRPGVEVRVLMGLRHEPFNEVERETIFAEVGAWLEGHVRGSRSAAERTGPPPERGGTRSANEPLP